MRLTVETGPLAGTVITLDRDLPALLGSGEDCAVRVTEAGVSPHHAVVKALRESGFGLKALANGVRVNGVVVEATPLRDGDVIEIGTTRIAFGQLQQRGLPHIPGYRVLEELGRGGMGCVYRAEQTSLHREVALKVLNRELTKDPLFVGKFVAEARAAAKLQHPNVVQVFDVDHDGDLYFFAMELMHDGSCEDWLKQHGAMSSDRALRIVADAAAGLAYAESLGIVHRDIKPDNLMLDQHGAVKIADLGLASTVEQTEEKAIGTPHFMAPEQVLKKEIDHRTDLYALGCTFYRLVTGKTPFRGATVKDILRAQVKDDAEPANKANPDVPAEVAAIVQRLMAKDPGQRYQTANDLLEDLGALLQPPAKKGLWIGLAAAAALIAGGAIWWAATRPKDIETVTEYRDNPEAARLARENAQLKKDLREANATIAFDRADRTGGGGAEIAAALDTLAAQWSDTAAAATARTRAAQLRTDAAAAARARDQRQQQLAAHVDAVQQAARGPADAGDFAAALAALDAPPPPELRDEPLLQRELQPLRDGVLAAARARLQQLVATVEQAVERRDEGAVTAAADALASAAGDATKWPAAMATELVAARNHVATARTTSAQLAEQRGDVLWQRYAELVGERGLRPLLQRHDYAAAAAAATQFARTAAGTPAAERSERLAAALEHAGRFADAFDRAIAAGTVTVVHDGATLQVSRWDRPGQQLVAIDAAKKPAKEQLAPLAGAPVEVWQTLVDGVTAAPGSRECFLAWIALPAHASAARTFLERLRADDDASGTGANAYPLNAAAFEALLRRLPEQDDAPWVATIRNELQAGHRLAAGLRALSERRNLAAAAHLERLLADHPHSVVVAAVP